MRTAIFAAAKSLAAGLVFALIAAIICYPAFGLSWALLVLACWAFSGYAWGWGFGHKRGYKTGRLLAGHREQMIVDSYGLLIPALCIEDPEDSRAAARDVANQTLTVIATEQAALLIEPLITAGASRRWRLLSRVTGIDPFTGSWYVSRTAAPGSWSAGIHLTRNDEPPPNPLASITEIPDYPPEPEP